MKRKFEIETNGKTKEEAIELALKSLDVCKEDVVVEVLLQPKKLPFHFLQKKVEVKVSVKEIVRHKIEQDEKERILEEQQRVFEKEKQFLIKNVEDKEREIKNYFNRNRILEFGVKEKERIFDLINENRRIELIHIIRKQTLIDLERAKEVEWLFIELKDKMVELQVHNTRRRKV